MYIEQILAALGLLGIGGILQLFIGHIIGLRKKKNESKQDLKEKRYKAIIILCYAFFNYTREQTKLIINRPDISSREALLNELNVEWINMSLYAPDSVILKMKDLLLHQDINSFHFLIVEMRKDLYGVKTKLNHETFDPPTLVLKKPAL